MPFLLSSRLAPRKTALDRYTPFFPKTTHGHNEAPPETYRTPQQNAFAVLPTGPPPRRLGCVDPDRMTTRGWAGGRPEAATGRKRRMRRTRHTKQGPKASPKKRWRCSEVSREEVSTHAQGRQGNVREQPDSVAGTAKGSKSERSGTSPTSGTAPHPPMDTSIKAKCRG